jgi:hypothetical protein
MMIRYQWLHKSLRKHTQCCHKLLVLLLHAICLTLQFDTKC